MVEEVSGRILKGIKKIAEKNIFVISCKSSGEIENNNKTHEYNVKRSEIFELNTELAKCGLLAEHSVNLSIEGYDKFAK